MSFKTASLVFWTLIVALLGARVAFHDQIALGSSPAGQLLAWLMSFVA